MGFLQTCFFFQTASVIDRNKPRDSVLANHSCCWRKQMFIELPAERSIFVYT